VVGGPPVLANRPGGRFSTRLGRDSKVAVHGLRATTVLACIHIRAAVLRRFWPPEEHKATLPVKRHPPRLKGQIPAPVYPFDAASISVKTTAEAREKVRTALRNLLVWAQEAGEV
jgi:hypothetical protein